MAAQMYVPTGHVASAGCDGKIRWSAPAANMCEMKSEGVIETTEYGYLQIDSYRSKSKKRPKGTMLAMIDPPQWVALPKGVKVHTFSREHSSDRRTMRHCLKPMRSCLSQAKFLRGVVEDESPRSTLSDGSQSTMASSSDSRRVRFPDGVSPGADTPADGCSKSQDTAKTKMAEWIYVDRDICGFSLYEYAPEDTFYKQFASSDFAREFLQDLLSVEFRNQFSHNAMMISQAARDRYNQEEDELNMTLLLAGVKPSRLRSD